MNQDVYSPLIIEYNASRSNKHFLFLIPLFLHWWNLNAAYMYKTNMGRPAGMSGSYWFRQYNLDKSVHNMINKRLLLETKRWSKSVQHHVCETEQISRFILTDKLKEQWWSNLNLSNRIFSSQKILKLWMYVEKYCLGFFFQYQRSKLTWTDLVSFKANSVETNLVHFSIAAEFSQLSRLCSLIDAYQQNSFVQRWKKLYLWLCLCSR